MGYVKHESGRSVMIDETAFPCVVCECHSACHLNAALRLGAAQSISSQLLHDACADIGMLWQQQEGHRPKDCWQTVGLYTKGVF